MKLFGFDIHRAKTTGDVATKPLFTPHNPQGPLTSWFQDYVFRKVSGEFYEVLREAIPIIDSAIRRLISLNGTIKVIGDNAALVRELEDFCTSVPVNDMQHGIQAFLENSCNEVFEQGFAISEFVLTKDLKDIAGLRVSDSKQIFFRRNTEGIAEPWYRYGGFQTSNLWSRPESAIQRILTATYSQPVYLNGMWEIKLNPDNKLYFSINNENTDPHGVSMMRSLEFVSKVLVTMQNSVMNVWERFGDPIYHLNYKTTKRDMQGTDIEARRKKIETDFNAAIAAKRTGKSADFVTAVNTDASIEIKVIGSDNQVLTLDVPARHILEQIVSKTSLPAWMLGIYWSTTERMATLEVEAALQDARIRQLAMIPEFLRLFSMYLKAHGRTWKQTTTDPNKPGDWGFIFETPNLRDLVAQAQARFLNAQADMMGAAGSQTQTTVNVGAAGATFEITTKNVDPGKKKQCDCATHQKETSRPKDWPELDKVEQEYEDELKFDWKEFQGRVFTILGFNAPAAAADQYGNQKDLFSSGKFEFTEEQRKAIEKALAKYIGQYDPADPDSAVRYYYSQAYSLGVIEAALLIGKQRPILDIIRAKEIFDSLCDIGFELVKNDATRAMKNRIIPEMEEQMIAGANPVNVAERLEKLFGDVNSDWERLARSEMTMAAEQAKLDEWKEWKVKIVEFTPAPDACPACMAIAGDYPIQKCPVPVRDTHPRCRCSIRPAVSEV